MAEFSVTRRFRAPIRRVFRAWSDPRDLKRWSWGTMGAQCKADVDFRVGGKLLVSTARPNGERWSFSGEYVEIVPGKKIVHTLAWQAPMGYEPVDERISARFADEGGETTLLFRHRGELSEASLAEHGRGWNDVLDVLQRLVESDPGSADDGLTIDRLRQVALPVKDLDRSIAFYRDALGLDFVAKYPPGLAFFRLGRTRLLLERSDKAPAVGAVLYFEVADIHAAHSQLVAKDVAFDGEPRRIFRDESGTFGPPGGEEWMAFFKDPDGNALALASRTAANG
jgi:methylmalonyl-CoA/ethylmalonyl-CoA epimerase